MNDQVSSEHVSFGYEEVSPEEKTRRVGAVFSSVARKYDVMNDAMSAGLHRLWKDKFVRRVKPRPGESILDMAGGTGDIAFRMARHGALVTVSDINEDMLAVGVDRAALDVAIEHCAGIGQLAPLLIVITAPGVFIGLEQRHEFLNQQGEIQRVGAAGAEDQALVI